jgi:hypothetical protein
MTNPDSPTSPPGAPLEAEVPGFGPSQRDNDPIDPTRTTVTVPASSEPSTVSVSHPVYDPNRPLEEQLDDDLGDEDWSERLDPRNLTSSSRASTSEPDPVVASALEQLAKLGVTLASLGLNRTIGAGNGAWIMHDTEADAIAAPLGRIGARHAPVGDGVAGDVADGIEAGLATAGYAMRATADHTMANRVDTPEPDVDG